ncbi:Protein SIEVE ELEMENT OCCLUSION B, partial [Frankliniella fusca]
RPSEDQWETLLKLIEDNKELLYGQFLAPGGVVRTRLKWEEIAATLNNVPEASAWFGLRSLARSNLGLIAAYRNGTGGGPAIDIAGLAMSALHKKVLNLTEITAAVGTNCPDPLRIQLESHVQLGRACVNGSTMDHREAAGGIIPEDADDFLVELDGNSPHTNKVAEVEDDSLELHDEDIGSPNLESSMAIKMPQTYGTNDSFTMIDLTKFEEDEWPMVLNGSPKQSETEVAHSPVNSKVLIHTPPNKDSGFTPSMKRFHDKDSTITLSDIYLLPQ